MLGMSVLNQSEVDLEALGRWLREPSAGQRAAGAWILLAEADAALVPALQSLFADLNLALAGAVFPALVHSEGMCNRGLWAIAWEHMPPHVLLPEALVTEAQLGAQLRELVDAHAGDDDPQRSTLFMFVDAMVPNIGSLLDAAYLELADRVRYAGVNAGSETFRPVPCLFDRENLLEGGLLAALLPPADVVVEHGYKEPGRFVAASSTAGNRIQEIDWRPAFDVYRERIHEQFGVDVNRDNFYRMAVHFPFGIQRADGDVLVRIPVALEDDGSLFCVGEVPENAILALLESPQPNDAASSRKIAAKLLAQPGADQAMLAFYCAGRRLHLGADAAEAEIRALAEAVHPRPLVGALSLGEIGSSHRGGYPLFHNAALVAVNPAAA